MKILLSLIMSLAIAASVTAADAPVAAKTATIDVKDMPVRDVLKDIANATGEVILVERLVDGKITASIKDADIEKSLNAVTKTLGIEWRKIQVVTGSPLAKDADALAAQMRTVLTLKFPDIIILPAGTGGSFAHIQREATANEIAKAMPSPTGFTTVYLVTDDEKAYKQELKDESKRKVAKYVDTSREMMNMFLEMTPEERTAVLKESINLMNQLGPEGMSSMMNTLFETDPTYLNEINKVAMQAIMNLDTETRRKMLRIQIQQQGDIMKSLTPEQMKQLQDDIAAITAELNEN